MGVRHSQSRLQNSIHVLPQVSWYQGNSSCGSVCSGANGRSRDSLAKGCHTKSSLSSSGVLFNLFPGPKENRRSQTNIEFETNKWVHRKNNIQNGNNSISYSRPGARVLDGFNRFKRCLFSYSHPSKPLSVSKVFDFGSGLRVQGSSLWANNFSQSVHKGVSSSHGVSQVSRHNTIPISRRHFGSSSVPGTVVSVSTTSSAPVVGSGLHHKCQEVTSCSHSGLNISGSKVSNQSQHHFIAPGQSRGNVTLDKTLESGCVSQSQILVNGVRSNVFHGSNGSQSKNKNKTHTVVSKKSLEQEKTSFKSQNHGNKRSVSSTSVVETHSKPIIRFAPIPSSNTGCSHDRCLFKRLGGCVEGGGWGASKSHVSRDLVPTTSQSSHQYSRIQGSISSPSILSHSTSKQDSSHKVRQFNSLCLHKKHGGHSVSTDVSRGHVPMGMVLAGEHSSALPAHTRNRQLSGGRLVPTAVSSQGMESALQGCHNTVSGVGQAGHRPLCLHTQQQVAQFLHSLSLSNCSCSRRVYNQLGDFASGLCLPSHLSHSQGVGQSAQRTCQVNSDSSTLATEKLVFSLASHVGGNTTSTSSMDGPVVSEQVVPSSSSSSEIGCMENQRNHFRAQGFSDKVISTMLHSRKSSTKSLYNAKWLRFSNWCGKWGVNPSQASIQLICQFLQHLFDKGFQYTTIAGYVSAISLGHRHFTSTSLGSCVAVKQFLKGVFRLRPSIKTIVPRWDLNIVLEALLHFPYEPLESASLQALTWKVVFLVAITSAARVSELQALDSRPELLKLFDSKVVMRANPAFLPKVLNSAYMAREIVLSVFNPSDCDISFKLLCPVRALKVYLAKTETIRKDHNLFVSYAAGHVGYKVTPPTISRWIRDTICQSYDHAGLQIPRSQVRAHSTRAVASTLANIAGVSPIELCQAAMWSSSSVFARFYRLDMFATKGFVDPVLSTVL